MKLKGYTITTEDIHSLYSGYHTADNLVQRQASPECLVKREKGKKLCIIEMPKDNPCVGISIYDPSISVSALSMLLIHRDILDEVMHSTFYLDHLQAWQHKGFDLLGQWFSSMSRSPTCSPELGGQEKRPGGRHIIFFIQCASNKAAYIVQPGGYQCIQS